MNTVSIKGIEYNVVQDDTPETYDDKGLHNLAREMRKNNATHALGLQRPNGKRLYTAYQFKSGNFSKVIALPW